MKIKKYLKPPTSKRLENPPWHSEPSPCGSHNPIARSMALTNVSAASRHQSSRSLPRKKKPRQRPLGCLKTQRNLTFWTQKLIFVWKFGVAVSPFSFKGPFFKVKQPLVFGLDGLGFSPKVWSHDSHMKLEDILPEKFRNRQPWKKAAGPSSKVCPNYQLGSRGP